MNVEYSKRAVADLCDIAEDSRAYGESVAIAAEAHIRAIIKHIGEYPEAMPSVLERAGIHAAAVVRYPYVIFYRILEDRVRILHIRHTSRRQWR